MFIYFHISLNKNRILFVITYKIDMSFKIILLTLTLIINNPLINETRELFIKGAEDKRAAEKLMELTAKNQSDPLLKAYHAMSYALIAKHTWNPYKKFENVKISLKLLNESIESDQNNLESRFLRFCIEDNIPSFFPFASHIDVDKKFILSNLKANHPIYSNIISYMKKAKHLNVSDKIELNRFN